MCSQGDPNSGFGSQGTLNPPSSLFSIYAGSSNINEPPNLRRRGSKKAGLPSLRKLLAHILALVH
jgi:hypothetical protein